MNLEQLKKGQQLAEIIKRTEDGLNKLKEIQSERKSADRKDNEFDDGQYNFSIGKWKDGSNNADLTRYMGNAELLDVIIDTVEKQLNKFNKQFKEL